jgi:OPA family sugar phosphate sensor protein UhpC-like MFS transporter
MKLFNIFRPAPMQPLLKDKETIKKKYRYWRFRVFYSMYIGYALFYITRKSFTFAMPFLTTELGYTKAQLGIIGSMLYITYGISKFFSGVQSDRSNPRYFMATGLVLTGFFNIFFGMSSSIVAFMIFWGLNGWFQGWGWPPCAKLLTHWYAQSERGTWWGIWNTSHNIGAALIPFIVVFSVQHYGWRYALYVPGVLCILGGFFLLNRLTDTPRSLGLPTIEKFKNEMPKSEAQEVEKKISLKQLLVDYVLGNKYIWLLGFASFFVYIIRTAINDWTLPFLIEDKGFTATGAAACLFWFEIGGFFGSLVAGWSSDFFFDGRRGPINVLFSLFSAIVVISIYFIPGDYPILHGIMIFLIGFMIFGPQMLIGMAAAELSHVNAAGAATGFVGWFAYIGAAVTGFPIGLVTERFGWGGFFIIMCASGLIAVLLLLPLWSLTHKPKETEG